MKQRSGALRVLVLTDHRAHNADNSVYDLCRSLAALPDIEEVSIASYGNPLNAPFFQSHLSTRVFAHRVGLDFQFETPGTAFMLNSREVETTAYDWLWLRLPRPLPDGFLAWLTAIMPEDRIVNRPSGIIETSNKAFLLQLRHWCPEMHLCTTFEQIETLQKKYPVVLKPLENYGGAGIIMVNQGIVNRNRDSYALETYAPVLCAELNRGGYLAMRYLKNVFLGDKRIVVVNGQIIGAALRKPAPGSWMCNAAQGGISEFAKPDTREIAMIEELSAIMLSKGIVMFGIDTLTDDDGQRVLSEINTLSIGGIKQIAAHAGLPLVDFSARCLLEYFLTGSPTTQQLLQTSPAA